MGAADDKQMLVFNAFLAALAALLPFWFYHIGLEYSFLQKLPYMFRGLAWDPIALNVLLSIPFVFLAIRALRLAGSFRRSVRLLIIAARVCVFHLHFANIVPVDSLVN